jgi:NADP-dependent 3-hydroxy acid dehydrogenase YdfG
MAKNAIVTGAGSGVGRATALALLNENWNVALIGRNVEKLKETASLNKNPSAKTLICECDISDYEEVKRTAESIFSILGEVELLVNAAGTNVPTRSFAEVSIEDYQQIIETNLNGAFYWIKSVLPQMRKRRSGTIINIVSDAGKLANAKAGAGYVASKFGLTGLTQSLNAEERQNGIRACAIFPGDIDTPLLNKRPVPPTDEARKKMLKPEDIAKCVMLCVNLPQNAIVEEILIRPA